MKLLKSIVQMAAVASRKTLRENRHLVLQEASSGLKLLDVNKTKFCFGEISFADCIETQYSIDDEAPEEKTMSPVLATSTTGELSGMITLETLFSTSCMAETPTTTYLKRRQRFIDSVCIGVKVGFLGYLVLIPVVLFLGILMGTVLEARPVNLNRSGARRLYNSLQMLDALSLPFALPTRVAIRIREEMARWNMTFLRKVLVYPAFEEFSLRFMPHYLLSNDERTPKNTTCRSTNLWFGRFKTWEVVCSLIFGLQHISNYIPRAGFPYEVFLSNHDGDERFVIESMARGIVHALVMFGAGLWTFLPAFHKGGLVASISAHCVNNICAFTIGQLIIDKACGGSDQKTT